MSGVSIEETLELWAASTRSWHGWYQHVSLVMLVAIRLQANTAAPPKSSLSVVRKSRR